MSATNVYGNVREYDTGLDVFGNVFDWGEAEAQADPTHGWAAKSESRTWPAPRIGKASACQVIPKTWVVEKRA